MCNGSVADDILQYCPILKREISEAFCYEINSVAFGLCNPSLIDNLLTREETEPICENCERKQM